MDEHEAYVAALQPWKRGGAIDAPLVLEVFLDSGGGGEVGGEGSAGAGAGAGAGAAAAGGSGAPPPPPPPPPPTSSSSSSSSPPRRTRTLVERWVLHHSRDGASAVSAGGSLLLASSVHSMNERAVEARSVFHNHNVHLISFHSTSGFNTPPSTRLSSVF